METSTFEYENFTWETNVHFLHYAGTWAVPLRHDLSDEDLEELLDSVNGVFFPGGATDVVNRETGEKSQFYLTAEKVWDYMKRQKDEEGIDFPIFGICQGFELIHYDLINQALATICLSKRQWPFQIPMQRLIAMTVPLHYVVLLQRIGYRD